MYVLIKVCLCDKNNNYYVHYPINVVIGSIIVNACRL